MKNLDIIDSSEKIKNRQNFYRRVQGLLGEQSFCLVLPKQYAINLGIGKGDYVKVSQEGATIIIEKAN